MKTFTLRHLDKDLERSLQARAQETSESLNRTILNLLREALGLNKKRRRKTHHDLDALAGTWNQADLKEFERSTASLNEIDKDMWQ